MLHFADGNARGWWWQWWQWTLHMDDGWWSNRQLGKLPFNWMHLIMATVSSWMMIMMTMMTTKKMMLMIGYGNLATWQLGKMPSSSMPGQLNGGGARRRFAAPVNIRLAAMILIFTHGYNCRPVPHVTSRSFKMFSVPYIYKELRTLHFVALFRKKFGLFPDIHRPPPPLPFGKRSYFLQHIFFGTLPLPDLSLENCIKFILSISFYIYCDINCVASTSREPSLFLVSIYFPINKLYTNANG